MAAFLPGGRDLLEDLDIAGAERRSAARSLDDEPERGIGGGGAEEVAECTVDFKVVGDSVSRCDDRSGYGASTVGLMAASVP